MKKMYSTILVSLISILSSVMGMYQLAWGEILIEDNFESGNLNKWVSPWGEIGSSNPIYGFITETEKYEGNHSFQTTIPAGANEGGKLRFSFTNNQQEVIYVRWYQKWESNWIWPNGIKLLILMAGNAPSPTQADLQFYALIDPTIYPKTETSNYINGQTKYYGYSQNLSNKIIVTSGIWYCFEYMIDAGTPGNNDGVIRYWVDDTLIADYSNLKLLPLSSYSSAPRFHWLILTSHGTPMAQTQSTWYDAFVMSTNRIGCQLSNDITPPSPPGNVWIK